MKELSGKAGRASWRGFTLIELMISMLLGLIVIAGVVSVFLANQRTYRTNEALSDVQDSSRVAFELMASDIREAGVLGCSNNKQIANVLSNGPANGGTAWWADWNNALHGYGTVANPALTVGTGATQQKAGTDSLTLLLGTDLGMSIASHDPAGAKFVLNQAAALAAGDVIIVCDPDHAAVLKVGSYTAGSKTITYKVGAFDNCSTGMGYPSVCTATGTAYTFGANAPVAKLAARSWYLGTNSVGTSSLYRAEINTGDGSQTDQEMVRGVTTMTISYHQAPQPKYIVAGSVTDWSAVDSVQVLLGVTSGDVNAGTDAKPITRNFAINATLRNRVK